MNNEDVSEEWNSDDNGQTRSLLDLSRRGFLSTSVAATLGLGAAESVTAASGPSAGGGSSIDGVFEPTGMPQYGDWTSTRIVGGGYCTGLETTAADPDRLYLRTDVGGVFRSDDGADTWYTLHDALPSNFGTSVTSWPAAICTARTMLW